MGHEFSIDVNELHMFSGYDWFDLGDECPHGCRHMAQSVVAWGSDVAHYELNECDDCGCRAWRDGRYYQLRHTAPRGSEWWRSQEVWRRDQLHRDRLRREAEAHREDHR